MDSSSSVVGIHRRVVIGIVAVVAALLVASVVQHRHLASRPSDVPVDPGRLSDLAALRHTLGDLEGAEPLYREALALREQARDGEELAMADACSDLGRLLKESGQYDEAEAWYARARTIRRARLPAADPALSASALDLGTVAQARGDYAKALDLYEEALSFAPPPGPEAAAQRAWVLSNQGVCLMHLGRMEEAGVTLRTAHAQLVRALGPDDPRVATSLARQVDWFERAGRRVEADAMRAQLRARPR